MEKKKSSIVYIIVIILLILGFGGYILVDQGIIKLDIFNKKEEVKEEKKKDKKEELDINSRLVQNLYNSISYDVNNWGKYWMFEDDATKSNGEVDYFVKNASEYTKMKLVSINFVEHKKGSAKCDDINIPAQDKDGRLSICALNSTMSASDIQHFYSREYVESLYKSLFGKDAKLDTSIPIQISYYPTTVYNYVESEDAYFEYYIEFGAGFTEGGYSTELFKAEKKGQNIYIYEEVTAVRQGGSIIDDNFNFIYTFELEDDGMYKFVSRVKEAK